ncbi:MAG TPA: hypothetical protein PK743_09990 [Luteimonas sp.]|nr:hypothetical protein [Luteimonas sp.]HRO26501.1 hypothetical protein [Luteimonas sp.]HRP72951.1 hypothetical protein [Luteimonas sp.]
MGLITAGVILVVSCSSKKSEEPILVESVNDLVKNHERYDDALVSVPVCLYITPHGHGLMDCNEEAEARIMFEAGEGEAAVSAFNRIIAKGYGSDSMQFPVLRFRAIGYFSVRETLPHYKMKLVDAVLDEQSEYKANGSKGDRGN